MMSQASIEVCRRCHVLLMPIQHASCFTQLQGFANESKGQEQQAQEAHPSNAMATEAQTEGTEASIMKKCKEVLERLKLNQALIHQDEKNLGLGHRMQHDAEFTFKMLLASRSLAQRQQLKNRPPGMSLQQLIDSAQ